MFHHTKGACNAAPCPIADDEFPGGVRDKMENWVVRLHQWGMQQRRRFCTVQDPLLWALAREKATSCNMHPNALAQVEEMDAGNKQKLSEKKAVVILTKKMAAR
jgi:hypothetical protein